MNLKKRVTILALSLFALSVSAAEPLLSKMSVYQLDADWTTSKGKEFKLAELMGNKQVVAMIYTDCPHACPIIVDTMKKVELELSEDEKDKTGFLLVSFTPETDTPEVLDAYAKRYELGNDWVLLQGTESDTRTFANLIGMKYKVQLNGVVDHANTLSVFDENGVLIKTIKGVGSEVDNIVNVIRSN